MSILSRSGFKIRPSAALIPFSDPGYPRDLIERFNKESERFLKDIDIDLAISPIVIEYKDVKSAVEKLKGLEVDFSIILILSWFNAQNVMAVLKQARLLDRPIFLWSHKMFRDEKGVLKTTGPIPGAGVIKQTFERVGLKSKFVWGNPGDDVVKRELMKFARAAAAFNKLYESRIGMIGYAALGMYTATFDHVSIMYDIGPEIDHIDQHILIQKTDAIPDEDVLDLVKNAKKDWEIGEGVTDEDLKKAFKMYLALKNLAKERYWDALTPKCYFALSHYYKFTPCIPISILGDDIVCACESDIPLSVTQLMMSYISGSSSTYVDVHSIEEDYLLLACCGWAPLSMAIGKPKISKYSGLAAGICNSSHYKKGKVTLARLALSNRGYLMHIGSGEIDLAEPFFEVGCPQYPRMKLILDGSTRDFGKKMLSQHYSIVYGDITEELLQLCEFLDITTIL